MNSDVSENRSNSFIRSGWFSYGFLLLFLFMIAGYGIWPFFQYPPSFRDDERTLKMVYAMTPQYLNEKNLSFEELKGPVIFDESSLNSRSSDSPFVWFTRPASGDQIKLLHGRYGNQDKPPKHFVERFYVVGRKPDWYHGRWILLNTGEAKYVKDSQIEWDTQTIVGK
ncbi:hypothetical protein [uncultured Gimesia sp.]|uniref:hypothetical protein n=1 Tax=uncultured Gimesia sp. TaxID=1678688 RepID=UPI00261AFA24|nr:hypothetical protein [uncultured Gimesia sp.]